MENIYFFWWLKYHINGRSDFTSDYIKKIIDDFRDDLPDFDKIAICSEKAAELFDLINENILDYERSDKDFCLEEIEEINERITPLLNEIYEEIELFRRFTPLSEEDFLMYEAEKLAQSSSLYRGLEGLVKEGFTGNEDELYGYLDELRDIIYDIQDGELEEIFTSSDRTAAMEGFTDLFQEGLDNLEEALEVMERAVANKDITSGTEGLEKLRTGLWDLKIIELICGKAGVK
ncbi:MAG: hypothetical protein ABRQ38_25235 [Candidatus Eremiobacterota bacterium]